MKLNKEKNLKEKKINFEKNVFDKIDADFQKVENKKTSTK